MRRYSAACLLLFAPLFCFLLLKNSTQSVSAEESTCRKYIIIFARGSGQTMSGQRPEMAALKSSLANYIDINDTNFVELDATRMPNNKGLKYNAAQVFGDLASTSTGLGAMLSRGNVGAYADSVSEGRELLADYVTGSNFLGCGTKIVLAGYSQGAHVITSALGDSRLSHYIPQISYVATFGDPSIDLNTIIGGEWFAKTPWYRGNATKFISGGVVTRRSPYIPSSIENKTGAWCIIDDIICTGNLFLGLNQLVNNPHGDYPKRAIPDAAREIAARLKEDLAQPYTPPACGALKQDIVIALNVSPSVIADKYFLTDAGVKKVVDGIKDAGCDVRVGMVAFGRTGQEAVEPIFELKSVSEAPLADALYELRTKPKSLTVEKVNVIGGINLAMDMNWREDAQKAVVVLSDAPGDNYKVNFWGFDETDFMKQAAVLDVLQKSREKGGVEIHAARIYHSDTQSYTYLPGSTSFYQYMAKFVALTAGTYQDRTNCGLCSWLDMHFTFKTKLAEKPVVSVPNIRVKVGQSIDLVAKDSSGGVIPAALKRSNGVSYSWFTDCATKGTSTLTGQTTKFTPSKVGTCHGAVGVRESSKAFCNACVEGDPYGSRAVTPFVIEVMPSDYTPPPLPGLVRNVTKERLWGEDTLRVTWDAPANAADVGELAYVVRDEDGTVLGITRSTQLDITDVSDNDEPIVLISSVSAGGTGALTSSEGASDISQPKPEPPSQPTTGGVLGVSTSSGGDIQQVLANAQLVSSPSTPTVAFRQITTAAETPMLFSPGQESIASVISQGVIHNMNQVVNAPTWLKITIMAIPVVTAIALGLTLKYTLRLRATKRY